MLNAENKQFALTDEGVILYQTDATNPLPGKPIGKVGKGTSITEPSVTAEGEAVPVEVDKDAVKAKLENWLHSHIFEILNPLMVLKDEEKIQDPAREICNKLYDAFGILPREDLEDLIGKLDETGRAALRQRKVRLGPVLVFLPLLNKPAAVRLRALLWQLWQNKDLPASVPHDGITSIAVEKDKADYTYYRAIGYPLYANRAIRVDMLDRIISAVYDSADKGVFKAKHEMAEWLGCPISDLYDVLEAMGHKKIHDPADEQTGEVLKADKTDAPAPVSAENIEEKSKEKTQETIPANAVPTKSEPQGDLFSASEDNITPKEETTNNSGAADTKDTPKADKQIQTKPELATFRLRKGKAYGGSTQKKTFRKQDGKGQNKAQEGKKPFKKKKPHHRKDNEQKRDRVVSAKAKKVEESPFAVLKELQRK